MTADGSKKMYRFAFLEPCCAVLAIVFAWSYFVRIHLFSFEFESKQVSHHDNHLIVAFSFPFLEGMEINVEEPKKDEKESQPCMKDILETLRDHGCRVSEDGKEVVGCYLFGSR